MDYPVIDPVGIGANTRNPEQICSLPFGVMATRQILTLELQVRIL